MQTTQIEKSAWQDWLILPFMAIVVVLAVIAAVNCFGQAIPGKVEAPPKAASQQVTKDKPQAADNGPSIPLTDAEQKDLEINRLKMANLQLQIQQVEAQIESRFHFRDQQAKLVQEANGLKDVFCKEHDLDAAKYKLDPTGKLLVPISPK
jgi:TolA-binding protein